MTFPFSRSEFFAVFARYNEQVWPAQLLLYGLAIVAIILALRRSEQASRGAHAVLAILWVWMGVVYQVRFFAEINPAARVFGVIFLAQSLVFLRLALGRNVRVFAPGRDLAGWAGAGLIVFGLVIYPMLSVAAGHRYPAQPTFGLPCPTTIFTLGMLLWMFDAAPRYAFVIPTLWALTGVFAAVQLSVTEDLSLAGSVAVVGLVLVTRKVLAHGESGKTARYSRNRPILARH
jgi:hypothetical protein